MKCPNAVHPAILPSGCVWSESMNGYVRLYPKKEDVDAAITEHPELSRYEAINLVANRISQAELDKSVEKAKIEAVLEHSR